MKEKYDELINNLLQLKFKRCNRFWAWLAKLVKGKSKDSPEDKEYQVYLNGIRKFIIKKNSVEDGKDPAYQVYLNMVREFLKSQKKRLLTEKEEEIVIAHLQAVAETYCSAHYNKRNDASAIPTFGITRVLSIETAKKVSELHEYFPIPTEDEVKQRVKEVLAVQNYLKEEKVSDAEIKIIVGGITNTKFTQEKEKLDLHKIAEVASELHTAIVSRFKGVPVGVDEKLTGHTYYIAVSQELYEQINDG